MKKNFLNLGKQPIANSFLSSISRKSIKNEYFYRLIVCFDTENFLVSVKDPVNPKIQYIKLSKLIGAKCIEIHTGTISRKIKSKKKYQKDLKNIIACCKYANAIGLEVHAGHGLDYKTAKILSKLKEIKEFNIGHFIIGESIFVGINKVIKKFKKICK